MSLPRLLLSLLLLGTLPLLVTGRARAERLQVLLIEGASNHDWERRIEVLESILTRDGSFDLAVSLVPQDVMDPSWTGWLPAFADYDVVISGYTDSNGGVPWPSPAQAAFEAYMANGGGFIAFHEATQAFPTWLEYRKIIGLGWQDPANGSAFTIEPDDSLTVHPPGSGLLSGHGDRADSLVLRHGLPTEHPIHAGLPAGWMAADLEVVRFQRSPDPAWATHLTILSHAADPDPPAGEPALNHPVEWAVTYGSGRSYGSTYGHIYDFQVEPEGVRCAAFQETLVRALKWCAGEDPGTAVPADFPGTGTVSLRPYTEGTAGFGGAQPVAPFANGVLPTLTIPPTEVETAPAFPNLSWESPIVATGWPGAPGELLVAEMDGRLFRLPDDDDAQPGDLTTVLDVRDRVWYMNWDIGAPTHKHGGILGCAFHPQFGQGAGRDFIYVYYLHHPADDPNATVDASNPYYQRLSRFSWTGTGFDPASELVMIQQFDTVRGHDGGGLCFGGDGFLHLSFGDEGTASEDSDPHTQKIDDRPRSGVWRIDVDQTGGAVSQPIANQPAEPPLQPGETTVDDIDHSFTQGYYIPSDNPWVSEPGALGEFYAIGLREPHRMTYDPVGDRFWIGDVGAGRWEEVDVMDAPGLNFQWNYMEGDEAGFRARPDPLIGSERGPVHQYDRGVGNCIIGGHVYRGSAIPELAGKYLFGDNGTQLFYALDYDEATGTAVSVTQVGQGRAGNIWNGIGSFGTDSQGEPLLLQMGAGTPGGGLISRIKRAGTSSGETWEFPPLLSATGLFSDLATLTPAPGLVPYEINMPLWSSGLAKSRWFMIPSDGVPDSPGETITYSENGTWQLPVGSVLVKHFADPVSGAPIETRLLVHGTDSWGGVSYKWRAGGTEADLLEDGLVEPLTVNGETIDYLYPARSQCWQCHQEGVEPVLGFRTRQLNRTVDYPGGYSANQIESLSAAGFIPEDLDEADLAGVITSARHDDPTVGDEEWVRSYLDSNCSHCHQPDGSSRAFFDARLTTPLANQSLICGPLIEGLGLPAPAVIKPGSLENSVLFQRLGSHDSAILMPPIARGPVHDGAVSRVANWILSMTADACTNAQSFYGGGELGLPGAPVGPTGSDPWAANIVIHKHATFTNAESTPVSVDLTSFTFHASAPGDPLTPFVVRLNGGSSYTVLAVGDTRSGYGAGTSTFDFTTPPTRLVLQPGETIAPGFIDALPDGSGGSQPESVSWTPDGLGVWHGGGPSEGDHGSVAVGTAPDPGANLQASQSRDYHFAVGYLVSTLQLGNRLDHPGYRQVDGANANFVINLDDTFTNPTPDTLTMSVERFRFHASRVTDPLTPFVVRINGPDDVTVIAVGDPQATYSTGDNDVPFSAAGTVVTVAPGETIATGFVDNPPDGTPGTMNGAVTFIDGGDSIAYRYDVADTAVTLELGQPPSVPLPYTLPPENLVRSYLFNVTLGFGGPEDSDGDGLADSWELAFAPTLGELDATGDADGDGMSDGDELTIGTDPTDRTSLLRTLEVAPDPTGASAVIRTVPGRDYTVDVSTDLDSWTSAGTFRAADWPATETAILLPAASLPPGHDQRLFLKVGSGEP